MLSFNEYKTLVKPELLEFTKGDFLKIATYPKWLSSFPTHRINVFLGRL